MRDRLKQSGWRMMSTTQTDRINAKTIVNELTLTVVRTDCGIEMITTQDTTSSAKICPVTPSHQ